MLKKIAVNAAVSSMVVWLFAWSSAFADYEAGVQAWESGKYPEAVAEWMAASNAGDSQAMIELGRAYYRGLGVLQDIVEAHKWFNLAASKGEIEALEERDAVTAEMTEAQLEEARARARQWKPSSGAVTQTDVHTAASLAATENPKPPAEAVQIAQSLLKSLGYRPGPADGVWGRNSVAAYQSFLRDAGLPASDTLNRSVVVLMRKINAELQKEGNERVKPMPRDPTGKEFQDCGTCPRMVKVPPGTFLMGSPPSEEDRSDREGPQHQVMISNPFAVGKFEVTFREWDACVSEGGCSHRPDDEGWGRGNRPVINVSGKDAQQYVSWLSRKTGEQYRLLSESEWEYVARAGTTGPFHFGSTISTKQANFNGNYTYGGGSKGIFREKTVSVGSFPANSFGLHDVHGNVWELVEDCWRENHQGAPSDGSAWEKGFFCWRRVLRGGSWYSQPWVLRSAYRYRGDGRGRYNFVGFRVARTLTL